MKNKKPLLISLICVGVCLILAAATLTTIFLLSSPLKRSFKQLFFDPKQFTEMEKAWDDGMDAEGHLLLPSKLTKLKANLSIDFDAKATGFDEDDSAKIAVTLGAGKSSVEVTLITNPDTVAIGGLLAEPESYITLPRKGAADAFRKSVYYHESGSSFAMEQKASEDLIETLEGLDNSDGYTVEDAMESITKKAAELADTETSVVFIGLTRTYTLDTGDMVALIDHAEQELKKAGISVSLELDPETIVTDDEDDDLGEFGDIDMGEEKKDDKNDENDEAASLADIRQKYYLSTGKIALSFTTRFGRLDALSVRSELTDSKKQTELNETTLSFSYKKNDLGIDSVSTEKITGKDGKVIAEIETVSSYRKYKDGDSIEYVWKDTVTNLLTDKEETATFTLSHNTESSDYELVGDSEKNEEDFTVKGTLKWEKKKGLFSFKIASYDSKSFKLSEPIFTFSVTPNEYEDMFVPKYATNLFADDSDELTNLLRRIDAKPINELTETLFDAELIATTVEGNALVPANAAYKKGSWYAQKYVDYLNGLSSSATFVPLNVYIYDSNLDMYFLLDLSLKSHMVSVKYTYNLTSDEKQEYYQAIIKNNEMKVNPNK